MIFRRNKAKSEYRMIEMDLSMPVSGWIGISDVNFDEHGNVHSWFGEPMPLYAFGTNNLRRQRKEMMVAFKRPVLKESELPRHDRPEPGDFERFVEQLKVSNG
jgi:hypothetical protein